jgi:hypothetical protein
MICGYRRRAAAVVSAMVVVAACVLTGSAVAKVSADTCAARAGATVSEDSLARVFERHGAYYACSRASKAFYELSERPAWFDRGSGFELAGRYVAWEQDQVKPSQVSERLELLDVDRGPAKTVSPGQDQGQSLVSFVLNDQGTAVWLIDGTTVTPQGSSYYSSDVLDSRSANPLATATSNGTGAGGPPLGELALSSDGKFVFWLEPGGTPAGARIPGVTDAAAAVAAKTVAVGRASATCAARAGQTVQENGQGRVFVEHKTDYACRLGSDVVHKLGVSYLVSNIEEAGDYVGWEYNTDQPGGSLKLLDVNHARAVTEAVLPNEGEAGSSAIPAYGLTDKGTIVWLLSTAQCDPQTNACSASSTVRDRSASGTTTLADVTNKTDVYPITSLGISSDGAWAFWIANGAFEAATLA